MKLKKNMQEPVFASFDDKNNNTYILLTNTSEEKLDMAKLAITFLNLKNDVVITDAFNLFNEPLPEMYGIYIEENKLKKESYLFDKFMNTMLIIEDELKDAERDV